jgi:hypothetical protein
VASNNKRASKKFRLRFAKIGKILTAITLGILVISCLIGTARTITTVSLENQEGVPLGWTGLESTAIAPRIVVNSDDIIEDGFCDAILISQSITNTDPNSILDVVGMTSWLNRGVTFNPNGGFINFSDGVSLEYSYNPYNSIWQGIAVSPPGSDENDSRFVSGSLTLSPAGQVGDTIYFRYRFQPSSCDEGLFNVLSAKTELVSSLGAENNVQVESRTTSIRPVRRGVYATNRRNIANNEYNRIGGTQFSTNSTGSTRMGRGITLRRGGGTGTWVISFDSTAQVGEYAIAYSASSAGAFMITLNVNNEGEFTFGDGGGHNASINHIKFGQIDDNGVVVVPDTLARVSIEESLTPLVEAPILDEKDEDDEFGTFSSIDEDDEILDDDYVVLTADEDIDETEDEDELHQLVGGRGSGGSGTIIDEDELEQKYSWFFRVPNTGIYRVVNDVVLSRWGLIIPLALFAVCFTVWQLNEGYIRRHNLRGNSKLKANKKIDTPKGLRIASPRSIPKSRRRR